VIRRTPLALGPPKPWDKGDHAPKGTKNGRKWGKSKKKVQFLQIRPNTISGNKEIKRNPGEGSLDEKTNERG